MAARGVKRLASDAGLEPDSPRSERLYGLCITLLTCDDFVNNSTVLREFYAEEGALDGVPWKLSTCLLSGRVMNKASALVYILVGERPGVLQGESGYTEDQAAEFATQYGLETVLATRRTVDTLSGTYARVFGGEAWVDME